LPTTPSSEGTRLAESVENYVNEHCNQARILHHAARATSVARVRGASHRSRSGRASAGAGLLGVRAHATARHRAAAPYQNREIPAFPFHRSSDVLGDVAP